MYMTDKTSATQGIELRRTSAEIFSEHRRTMEIAVSELYAAFRHRELSPGGPDVCTSCCVEPTMKLRLAATPKHAITLDDLATFHYAAKGSGAPQDIAYFFPRTMEFVSQGSDLNSVGLFSLFTTHSLIWSSFADREQQAVRQFCAALSRWRLALPEECTSDYLFADILEMCSGGGFDVTPVTKAIADPLPTFSAAHIIADMLIEDLDVLKKSGARTLRVMPEVVDQLGEALCSPAILALLEAAANQSEDDLLSGKAAMAHWIAEQVIADRKVN